MINMQLELRKLGLEHAYKEIVHLFETQYEIRDPVTKLFPKTYDDVLKIIQSPIWYNKNKTKSRNIIWMITYGIFRRNMDRWLQQVANTWTSNKNIKEFRTTQHRTGNNRTAQSRADRTEQNRTRHNATQRNAPEHNTPQYCTARLTKQTLQHNS